MTDGSADVSVSLGNGCAPREIGRGMATRATLVWALAESEVAQALWCDLVVRARLLTETGVVLKVASVTVMPEVGSSAADEGPQLQGTSCMPSHVRVGFTSVPRWARLSAGDSLVESMSEPVDPQDDGVSTEFLVSHLDFARAVLTQKPLVLSGARFDTSLSVGGVELEAEPPDP